MFQGQRNTIMMLFFAWMFTLCFANAHAAKPEKAKKYVATKVYFNQSFIEGVNSKVKIEDPKEIFSMIFSKLPDRVKVYPTENYYYFSFNANGKTIWGNLRLDKSDRDLGIIHLGYFEYDENGKFQDIEGFEKDFNADDGVLVRKLKDFDYLVTYKGRSVHFELNDIGMQPPKVAKLRKDEVYVGPVYDESGIQFFLVFNKTEKHFMYVLNEESKKPEEFRKIKDDVVAGKRTGFAYYVDKPNNRKILVAINGFNVQRNNYYDGPFDQLPDNYADQTNLKQYIEQAYPELKGKINKYGHIKESKGNRVLLASYFVYFDDNDLSFVESCRKSDFTEPKFYACITPDRA